MADDPFDRLAGLEEEIRRRVEEDRLTPEDAAALADLGADDALELTLSQLTRLLDEDIDLDVLRDVLDLAPGATVDEAIGLVADHAPEPEDLQAFAASGATSLTIRQLRRLLDHGVEPATLAAAVAYGSDEPVDLAVVLTDHADDPEAFLGRLLEAGTRGLSTARLRDLADLG